MIFNSVTFLVYLAVMVGLYWVLPRRPRLWLIFLGSLTFYSFWRVEYVFLMMVPTVVDYVAARAIYATQDRARRRLYLALSVGSNLAILFYFKYLIFFADAGVGLLQLLGVAAEPPAWSIILPLGISFYTFETISYTVDVYRGFIRPERDFVVYGCFVTFFPQLVAGPILRAVEKIPKLSVRPPFRVSDFANGLQRVIGGLFLKVVLADNLAPIVDSGFAQPVQSLSALDVWTLAFLFGFQIYLDFSGYSHIALGCARMMGIQFPENFDHPYLASSPREFWRRWHISLSSWIRDYLYLPLLGARVRDESVGGLATASDEPSEARRTRALFATWGIMGLWHGANWTFVLWGLYHAALVYGHRRLADRGAHLPERARALLGWGATLPLAMLGWIPFRAESIEQTFAMWGRLFQPAQYLRLGMRESAYLVAALVLVAVIAAWAVEKFVVPALRRVPVVWPTVQVATYTLAIALVFVFLRPISQFIYFQF